MNQTVPNIEPTKPQTLALMADQNLDLALAGARGWGKTFLLILLAVRFCVEYGDLARCLIVRRTYPALLDLEDQLRTFASRVFGPGAQYRKAERVLELPGGGRILLSQLEERSHYDRFQGQQFGLIAVDEATQHPNPDLINLLRTNLRAPEGIPTRFIVAANPGGSGHGWFRRRYISGRQPWQPFTEDVSGRPTMTCTATPDTNAANINVKAYLRQLAAGTGGEQSDLYKAWATGDWDAIVAGAFFADLDLEAIQVDPDLYSPEYLSGCGPVVARRRYGDMIQTYESRWETRIAIDHGFTAPCYALLALRPPVDEFQGPDGRHLHENTWIIVDEVALADPNDPGKGLMLDIPEVMWKVSNMAETWGIRNCKVVIDAATKNRRGQEFTELDEYERAADEIRQKGGPRLSFVQSQKGGRSIGLAQLRRLIAARDGDEQILVSRRCSYLLWALATIPRDPRHPDTTDTNAAGDDACDALRYLVTTEPPMAGWARRPW